MKSSPMSLLEEFIKEAFGSQYVIPVYQRKYTWTKNKQLKTLLKDIDDILNEKHAKHFIGTIVYVVAKTDFMVRERAIVDGQQRLITMFMMIHALRNIAIEIGENDIATTLTVNYLENMNVDNNYKQRLRPSVSDDEVYKKICERKFDEITNESSLITQNYNYMKTYFSNLLDHYKFIDIINALRKLYIVRIELDEEDDAQQIFESINSTGEALTAADLIRNYIMMKKNNEKQEFIYNEYWLKLDTIFRNSRELAEFFRLYLASKTFSLTTKKDLYRFFKEFWEEKIIEEDEKTLLDDIVLYAKFYERLYYSNELDRLGEPLDDFRKMRSLMPAPFIMYTMQLEYRGLISSIQLGEILKLINTYLIRRYIMGQDTSAITRFFPTYLKNVISFMVKYGHENAFEICKQLLINDTKQKATFMPDNEQILLYLKTANAYSFQHTRWLLEKIENENNSAVVNMENLSIEHIMPQTANEYWKKISGLNEENYAMYVNKLGNLTLASKNDNSKMSNNDFESKKAILKETSHIKINTDILNKEIWSVDSIDNRTEVLTQRLIHLFPYMRATQKFIDNDRKIFLQRNELYCEGYLNDDDSLLVYAGGQVRLASSPIAKGIKQLRIDLLDNDTLIIEDEKCFFATDYLFNSPSAAADFIIGNSNNGWDVWKDSEGKTINVSLR